MPGSERCREARPDTRSWVLLDSAEPLWVWHFKARNVSSAFPALPGANFHQTHARGPLLVLFLLSPFYFVIYYFESFLIHI